MQDVFIDHKELKKVMDTIQEVMVGKEETVVLCLTAFLAGGHVLLEDVPGVGKTMLVRTLAKSLDCDFRRIQFTPDLLPSDITGVSIYNPKEMEFEFRAGPIFGDVILADEINRTSPKTQSALLEAMEETRVTVDGQTVSLRQPFFVLATQNPIEYEGTYPLPEAQLDRFLFKLKMGYPSLEDEMEMLRRTSYHHPIDALEAVITKADVLRMQEEVRAVYIDERVQQYIVHLVRNSREHPDIQLGVSPRASIALMQAAKAYAYTQGRDFVLPDDVKYLAPYVMSHRILLNTEALYEGKTNEMVIASVMDDTLIPIDKGEHQ